MFFLRIRFGCAFCFANVTSGRQLDSDSRIGGNLMECCCLLERRCDDPHLLFDCRQAVSVFSKLVDVFLIWTGYSPMGIEAI